MNIAERERIVMPKCPMYLLTWLSYVSFKIQTYIFPFQAKVRSAALKLEQQIILADCQVLAAILNFINQVLPTTAVRIDKTLKKQEMGKTSNFPGFEKLTFFLQK